MGDSWEDEDFEVPVLAANLNTNFAVDEEEDEALKRVDAPVAVKPAAGVVKKAQEEAELLARKMEHALHENETSAQKKLRERLQAEEADTRLAGELFDGSKGSSAEAQAPVSVAKSIASIPLKTKEDHTKLGQLLSKRLATSSAFNVNAFYKALMPTLKEQTVTTEILDELMRDIKVIRDSRAVAEKPVKAAPVKKSKKEIEAEKLKHAEKFGGVDDDGRYDHYTSMEDDFM